MDDPASPAPPAAKGSAFFWKSAQPGIRLYQGLCRTGALPNPATAGTKRSAALFRRPPRHPPATRATPHRRVAHRGARRPQVQRFTDDPLNLATTSQSGSARPA